MPSKTFTMAIAAAVTATLALTALTACGPAAKSAQGQGQGQARAQAHVTMRNCTDSGRQTRPDLVEVLCASDAITARTLNWSGWGKRVATATGTATVNWCAFEGCAYGEYDNYPIVLVASKLVRCPKGGQQYSRMQYMFVGDDDPFASLPKKFKLTGEFFGSHSPGPANNNTVSLPC